MEKINGTQPNGRLRKVVVVGPESTGKTTLSQALARHFHTLWVPEYAREYLDGLNRPYRETDLLAIAQGQIAFEEQLAQDANGLLICDTDLLVLKVWSMAKFGRCHQFILDNITTRNCDLYLLTGTDVPWESDPQREHPKRRDELWTLYQNELNSLGANYAEISGNPVRRLKQAISLVADLV